MGDRLQYRLCFRWDVWGVRVRAGRGGGGACADGLVTHMYSYVSLISPFYVIHNNHESYVYSARVVVAEDNPLRGTSEEMR